MSETAATPLIAGWEPTVDYLDDEFWAEAINSGDTDRLTELTTLIKEDLADLQEEGVLRRAEYDTWMAEFQPSAELRVRRAENSRWRARQFTANRDMEIRLREVKAALRDHIIEGGDSARMVIHRLAVALLRVEAGETLEPGDFEHLLDATHLASRGRRTNLRDWVADGGHV